MKTFRYHQSLPEAQLLAEQSYNNLSDFEIKIVNINNLVQSNWPRSQYVKHKAVIWTGLLVIKLLESSSSGFPKSLAHLSTLLVSKPLMTVASNTVGAFPFWEQ